MATQQKFKPTEYSIGIGSSAGLVRKYTAKNRGEAFLKLMNSASTTLQQATDVMDACDAHGKGACYNIQGLLVQVQKT